MFSFLLVECVGDHFIKLFTGLTVPKFLTVNCQTVAKPMQKIS